jgi:hypothetical protein
MAENSRLTQGFLNVVKADAQPFALRPARMPDPKLIPPRQWIYGTQLIRGFVSLLVAPGGTGKSSYLLGVLLAIATKRKLLGTTIHQQCSTALLNLEDPQEEIDRRMAALGLFYNINDDDIAGRFFVSPADRSVTIATRSSDGFEVVYPDERSIIEKVQDERIGVLGVDPFAESHNLEENSNPEMISASAAWRRVARLGDCAVILTHHVRKGAVDSIEAARGAKALSDSARIGLLLSPMTTTEATQLNVPEDDRLQYVRLDDAKANMAPRAASASWFHLSRVLIGNATPEYPRGDDVVVIEAWKPASVWDVLTVEDCNQVLDRIAQGPGDGVFYSHTIQSGDRWAGHVLMDMKQVSEAQATDALKAWLKNGLLVKETYHDPKSRKPRSGLRVVDALRPGTQRHI